MLFLSTPSLRRATPRLVSHGIVIKISIHALLAEGDHHLYTTHHQRKHFYPRPPCGGRLRAILVFNGRTVNFYPRPPCGGRRDVRASRYAAFRISIHALLAEGDTHAETQVHQLAPISIHALLAEGDRRAMSKKKRKVNFYPRPPCGGRPFGLKSSTPDRYYFYPRPPCGGRLPALRYCPMCFQISIHALLAEGDNEFAGICAPAGKFLSTPSLRRATRHLYSRPSLPQFLSTPSLRRATHQTS